MQISVQFESLEEMKGFAAQLVSAQAPVGLERTAEPVKEEAVPEEEPKTAPSEETEEVSYTLVDVRGKLGALTKAGKKAQVQELIQSFGVENLSQIPEEKYPEVMQKAGEL